MVDLIEQLAEDKAMELREDLQTINTMLADMQRMTLEAAFKGGFSTDRINDMYNRISVIQERMVEHER